MENEFAASLIKAIELRQQRGELVVTLALLKSLVREALDPELYKSFERPPEPKQLFREPDYPRLKILYQTSPPHNPIEYKVVHNETEELPYMGSGKQAGTRWFTRPLAELDYVKKEVECAD
jgi:hypothetical protein